MPFEGTAAIVTGGASGNLVSPGAGRPRHQGGDIRHQADAIDAEVTRLRAAGGTVSGHVVDVSSREQVAAAVARVRDEIRPGADPGETAPASNSSASSPTSPTSSGIA